MKSRFDLLAEKPVNNGYTNQIIGHDLGEIARSKYILVGSCKGEIFEANGKSARGNKRYCNFETYNKKLDICPNCGFALKWKKQLAR